MTEARVADRRSVERWLRQHGVPNFVTGWSRPARILPRAFAAALVVAVGSGAALIAGTELRGLAVLAAIVIFAVTFVIAYAIAASGLVPLSLFGLRFLSRTLVRGGTTMLTVLPLLLVAVAFLFLGAETWQSVGRLHGWPLALTALLFVALGIAFVLRQVRPDLDDAERFANESVLRAALPADLRFSDEQITGALSGARDALGSGERMNLRAVVTIAQLAVAIVVGLAIFLFFVVFGVLVVGLDTVQGWSTETPQIWFDFTLDGHQYALTSEHVRVSAFLGVFSAFYFVVSASTDGALRANLTERATEHAETCLAVRAVYRSL
jgi:hypothetical protein